MIVWRVGFHFSFTDLSDEGQTRDQSQTSFAHHALVFRAMGVSDFLPRILAAAGRSLDLQQYTQVVDVRPMKNDADDNNINNNNANRPSTLNSTNRHKNNDLKNNSTKRSRPWEENDDKVYQQGEEDAAAVPKPKRHQTQNLQKRQRPMRIAVDVSVWIAKAAHGFGDMLLDERHLSNYGRASLLEQQQEKIRQLEAEEQKVQRHDDNNNDDDDEGSDAGRYTKSNDDEDQNDPHWKIQGTARPRRHIVESPNAMKRRAARLAYTAASPTDPSRPNNQNDTNCSAPNAQMVQNYITTCAQYVMKRLDTLRELTKADILVVLDGKTPPIKAIEVKRRSDRRNEAEQMRDDGPTLELDEDGAAATALPRMKASRRAGAGRYYGDVVSELLKAMRQNQIPFLVAPYEADAQLAYLSTQGYIDLIITEDSDLLAHGPRSILFKAVDPIGQQRATGILVHTRDLGAGTGNVDLTDFSTLMLAIMFVAAGCDYCEKLKGIGIVSACNIVRGVFFAPQKKNRAATTPVLERIFQNLYRCCQHKYISNESKRDFEANFMAALAMYRHPVVYDPVQRKCVVVRDPMTGGVDPDLQDYAPYVELCTNRDQLCQVVGVPLDSCIATHIAEGWINPKINHPYSGIEIPSYVQYDMDHVLKGGCDVGDDGEHDTQDATQEPFVPSEQRTIASAPSGEQWEDARDSDQPKSPDEQRLTMSVAVQASKPHCDDNLESDTHGLSIHQTASTDKRDSAQHEGDSFNDGNDDEKYETADEIDDDDVDDDVVQPETQGNLASAPHTNEDGPPRAPLQHEVIDLLDSDDEGTSPWQTQGPTVSKMVATPDAVPSSDNADSS